MKKSSGFPLESAVSQHHDQGTSGFQSVMNALRLVTTSSLFSIPLGGCSGAPSISVLGAFFPDWMFCIMTALILTSVLHRVLVAISWHEQLSKLTITLLYMALCTLFAFGDWLIFFRN